MGIFGSLFDFNRDGKMSIFESAAEFAFLEELERESRLEASGLDPDDLEFMDEDERREALEDAGLDPEDFEF